MAPSPRAQVRSWLRPGEGRTETVPGILRGGLQEEGCHLDGRWEARRFAQEGPGSGGLKGEGRFGWPLRMLARKLLGSAEACAWDCSGPARRVDLEGSENTECTGFASGCDSLQRAAHSFPKRLPVSSPWWEEQGGRGVGINIATAVGK